ncbi:hypothetical protein D3C81_859480 [compost metagenome]
MRDKNKKTNCLAVGLLYQSLNTHISILNTKKDSSISAVGLPYQSLNTNISIRYTKKDYSTSNKSEIDVCWLTLVIAFANKSAVDNTFIFVDCFAFSGSN